MFYCGRYSENTELKRRGTAKTVVVNDSDKNVFSDMVYSKDKIEITQGNGLIVATDKFGLWENDLTIDIIFLTDGILIDILEGVAFFPFKDKFVYISSEGEVKAVAPETASSLYWVTREDVVRHIMSGLWKKYELPFNESPDKYLYDVRFTLQMNCQGLKSKTLTTNCAAVEEVFGVELPKYTPAISSTSYHKINSTALSDSELRDFAKSLEEPSPSEVLEADMDEYADFEEPEETVDDILESLGLDVEDDD